MQFAQNPLERRINLFDETRLLGLGIGFVRDADVQVKSVLALLRERRAANEPEVVRDVLQGNRDDRQLLAQHGLRQPRHGFNDAAIDGGIGLARKMYDDMGHDRLRFVKGTRPV
ncbi:hypothetical protein D3C77_630760 [compost metagenome]